MKLYRIGGLLGVLGAGAHLVTLVETGPRLYDVPLLSVLGVLLLFAGAGVLFWSIAERQ